MDTDGRARKGWRKRVVVGAAADREDEQGDAHHMPRRRPDVLPVLSARSQDLEDLSNMNSTRGAFNRGSSMAALKKPVRPWLAPEGTPPSAPGGEKALKS